jgi:hypothetical protein
VRPVNPLLTAGELGRFVCRTLGEPDQLQGDAGVAFTLGRR